MRRVGRRRTRRRSTALRGSEEDEVGQGGALLAQAVDGEPRGWVCPLDLTWAVHVAVLGHGPFEHGQPGPVAMVSAPLRCTSGWARARAQSWPRGVSMPCPAVEIVMSREPGALEHGRAQREVYLGVLVGV